MRNRAVEDRLASVLVSEPEVAAAYVYGSRARARSTPLSDLDIAILPIAGLTTTERDRLLRRLVVQLGRLVPERILDVRFLDELPAGIAGSVLAEGDRLVDNDPARRVNAEVAIRMRYHDFLPFQRAETDHALAGLRRRLERG